MSQLEQTFFEYLNNLKAQLKVSPLILGGISDSGGGTGGPPGGFVGYLPQTKVSFDYTESGSNIIPASGASLLHNLNRIRYRISALEAGSGEGGSGITVYHEDELVAAGITVLNFKGGVSVNNVGTTANITVTASSVTPSSTTTSYMSKEWFFDGVLVSGTRMGMTYRVGTTSRLDEVSMYTNEIGDGTLIVDVNNNGDTIFPDPITRPMISGEQDAVFEKIHYFTINDKISIDIDSAGGYSGLTLGLHFTNGISDPGNSLLDENNETITDENDAIISEDY